MNSNLKSISYFIFFSLGSLCYLPPIYSAPVSSKGDQPKPKNISYAEDVHPILARSCAQCHGGGRDKGDFRIDSRETILKGGQSGPAVVVGHADQSLLMDLVSGKIEGKRMPMKGQPLSDEEIAILRVWIDQGLIWDSKIKAVERRVAPLAPRKPEIPGLESKNPNVNPIDVILDIYFKSRNVAPPKPVEDAVYMRRAYLDAVGLLPSPEELQAFAKDKAKDKRVKLVERLLADNRAYAEQWMTFWNDALRNDFQGTGYIDGGRKQITQWLYTSLATNKPFDQFVRELINPNKDSEGFIKGIVWRGVTNASQTPAMQAAQNISQVFMGTNLKCASCHDSFVNQWKLKDSYGLAAIFADEPLEIVRCDVPQGSMAQMHFLFPELGEIDPSVSKQKRLEQLAAIMTKKENGRLTRTIVNRLWEKFMGRGIVEPLDDMDQQPWSADLLDWLSFDLAENGCDLKRTIKLILTSKAYQLPTAPHEEIEKKEYVFRGPAVRRMSGEQFLDALACLTGVWGRDPGAKIDLASGADAAEIERVNQTIRADLSSARWIWSADGSATEAPQGTVYFRKSVKWNDAKSRPPSEAALFVSCDNEFTLYVNGNKASEGKDWSKPVSVDLGGFLRDGENVFAVEATNTQKGPAGLIVQARIRRGNEKLDFATDASWLCSDLKFKDWEKPEFIPLDWRDAVVIGWPGDTPWKVERRLVEAVRLETGMDKIRAWLAKPDPLQRALGRPNREQVVTRRQSVATTLQALELTNGATLAGRLQQGAKKLIGEKSPSPSDLTTELYLRALARKPNWSESRLARRTIGSPPKPEGVEDFLWTLLMSPEFQLIY